MAEAKAERAPAAEPAAASPPPARDDLAHVKQAWAKLAALAATIVPTEIYGEPNEADGKAMIRDLEVLARDVDALIHAYGWYAYEHGCVRHSAIKECFTDQLTNALEGNAMFAIEEGVRDRMQHVYETAAE